MIDQNSNKIYVSRQCLEVFEQDIFYNNEIDLENSNLKERLSNEDEKLLSNLFNSDEELMYYINKDIKFLELHNQSCFADVSIAMTYEFSEKKYNYKYHLKNEESNDVYKLYKKLVAKLREEKLPFRVIDLLIKKKINAEFLHYNSYKNEFSTSDEVLKKIINESKLSKKKRKKLLHEYEVKLLKECSLETFELASRINWFHGTNSSLLPFLPHTGYSLIPTGKLLEKGIAPMSGEISKGGLYCGGCNQNYISVETIKGLSCCWEYASKISYSCNPKAYDNIKYFFENEMKELSVITPFNNSWDTTLVSLYRLKQWSPKEFQALCKEYGNIIIQLKEKLTTAHSSKEKMMLKALDYDSRKLKDALTNEITLEQVKEEFPAAKDRMWEQSMNGCNHNLSFLWDPNTIQNLNSRSFNINHVYNDILLSVIWLKIFGQEQIDQLENDVRIRSRYRREEIYIVSLNYDPESNYPYIEKILNNMIRPIMESRIQKNNALPYLKRMQKFERLFEEEPFIHLSDIDKTHLINPIPMLLASTKSKSMGILQGQETNVQQPLFGKDVNLIFVEEKNVDTIKSWLIDYQLIDKVHVFSTFFLKDLKNIPLYHSPQQILFSKPYMSQEALENINQMVQNQVIPIYRKPYPDQTERKWHGVAHALRVLLFSHVIGSLYKEAKYLFLAQTENLHVAAALHDAARLNDGVDLWDQQSGQLCKDILIKNNVPEQDAELLAQSIAEKDNKFPIHIEQKVIHDADCIEILRCLRNVDDFESDELWIMRELDKEIGFQFIEEAKILIKLTEENEVKKFLESSKDPLKCLYQILFYINENYDKCDLLAQHLHQCQSFFDSQGQYLLNKKLEEIIQNNLNK